MNSFLPFIHCPKDPREAAFMAVWREEVVKKFDYKYQKIWIMPQISININNSTNINKYLQSHKYFSTGGEEAWLQPQADQVANLEQSKQGEELIGVW